MENWVKTLASILLLGILGCVFYIYDLLWLRPEKLRKRLRGQGIKGPSPSFFYGNLREVKRIQSMAAKALLKHETVTHDYFSTVFPHFDCWRKTYGPNFMYTIGSMPILYISEPILLKEFYCKYSYFWKPAYLRKNRAALLGLSVITSNGKVWAQQRRIIAPALFIDKIKGMLSLMVESLSPILRSWELRVQSAGGCSEITLDQDLKNFTADVISRACFGSSFTKGKDIFSKLKAMQTALTKQIFLVGIPGLRCFPTETNREIWRLEKEIKSLIMKVVKEREDSTAEMENDLLQAMLQGMVNDQSSPELGHNFVIENCKAIYFAGHETTANTLSWILLLLALHPDWQARVRSEAVEMCEPDVINTEALSKMKMLTMVIQETMRLYPVATILQREAPEEHKVGDLLIPKGTIIWTSLLGLQQDTGIWGPDAMEFKPERFTNGISGACKIPQVYVPFGTGPRVCLGQAFAMMEMKLAVSLILSRFTLSLSPSYLHCPKFGLTLEPGNGMTLMFTKV